MEHECKCRLNIEHLTVWADKKEILHDVSFEAHHAEITALIGRNGAGKTTLLRSILGAIPYSGRIEFYDSEGELVGRPKIGYVPQNTILDRTIPVTVGEFLSCGCSAAPVWLVHRKKAIAHAAEILRKTGGEMLIDRPLSSLSGGELQRVLLAFALDPMPQLLLLDEPVSAVDRRGIESFYEVVTSLREEYHMPILLVSHDLGHVRKYATDVVLLDQTVILSGKCEEVMASPEIAETFGLS